MIMPWFKVRVLMGWGLAVAGCGVGVSDGALVGDADGCSVSVRVGEGLPVVVTTHGVFVWPAWLIPLVNPIDRKSLEMP